MNREQIIEILVEEISRFIPVTKNTPFIQNSADRLEQQPEVSEREIDEAADRLIPHESGSQYVYDGFMICAKWMRSQSP